MKSAELTLPIEVTAPQARLMAVEIFGDHLLADLKGVFSARKSALNIPIGNVGETNPQLLALRRQLLAQEAGGSLEQIQAKAVESYLSYREDFVRGSKDQYGRPGYLRTIPSEFDSAASSVLMELEYSEEELAQEGPLYRVYNSKHKIGRNRLLGRIMAKYTQDTDDESEIISGKKIVVPLGPWAGYYASIFAPDDYSSPLLLWTYDINGHSFQENLRAQTSIMLQKISAAKGMADSQDAAILYACYVLSSIMPNDQRIEADVLSSIKRLGIEDPSEQKKTIFESISNYPKLFRSAEKGSLTHLEDFQKKIVSSTPDQGKQGEYLLANPGEYDNDPGLVTFAIQQMTKEGIYPAFIANIYTRAEQFRAELANTNCVTLEELRKHSSRLRILRGFGRVNIPWQAQIMLGESYKQVMKDIAKIDPVFKSEGRGIDFSLLHTPLKILPLAVQKHPDYVEEAWGALGSPSTKYFDLDQLLVQYMHELTQAHQSSARTTQL